MSKISDLPGYAGCPLLKNMERNETVFKVELFFWPIANIFSMIRISRDSFYFGQFCSQAYINTRETWTPGKQPRTF